MKHFGQKTLAEKYLEWVNDWLTVKAMAENYGKTESEMLVIIEKGKIEHEKNVSIFKRLEYLRTELRAERISYSELLELQSLAEHIDKSDVELLEAAGVPEFKD